MIEAGPAFEIIVANIVRIRNSKGLTAEEVSLLAKFPKNYLSRIETREIKRPRRPTLQRVANGLGVALSELLDGTSRVPVKFYERVRWLRESKQMTREALSEASGIPTDTLHSLETNQVERPRMTTLVKLAGALGVQVYDLLGDHSLQPVSMSWNEGGPTAQLQYIFREMFRAQKEYEEEAITDRQLYARQAKLLDHAKQLGKMLPHTTWPVGRK
jgi:transcriptional regulator with XRE-family HTH domain